MEASGSASKHSTGSRSLRSGTTPAQRIPTGQPPPQLSCVCRQSWGGFTIPQPSCAFRRGLGNGGLAQRCVSSLSVSVRTVAAVSKIRPKFAVPQPNQCYASPRSPVRLGSAVRIERRAIGHSHTHLTLGSPPCHFHPRDYVFVACDPSKPHGQREPPSLLSCPLIPPAIFGLPLGVVQATLGDRS